MITILEYLTYSIPVMFIMLSRKYMLQFNKLQESGRIPEIIGAKQRQVVFLVSAIISAIIILVTQLPAFSQSVYQDY
jgi:hypothetical protein